MPTETKQKEGKGFCKVCKKPMKACTCEADAAEAEEMEAEEAEEAEEDEAEEGLTADEAEEEDEEESESGKGRKGKEAEAEEAEGEEGARTKVLLSLRSKLDEAHDPETVSTLMDALKAYFDEEIEEAGEGGGEEEPEEVPEEEALAGRQAAAERDGFSKYAAEGEEEAQAAMLRGAAEKDGYKRYATETKCKTCGAPMKKKKAAESDVPEHAEGLRHRLLEKEVRFQMKNDETAALTKENDELKKKVAALEAEARPGKLLQEAQKYMKDHKVPEEFITAATLARFPAEQWDGIVELTVPAVFRESGGQGERTMTAPQYLLAFNKSLTKDESSTEAVGAFREAYGGGSPSSYPGSKDAEDPFAEPVKQEQK